MADDSGIAFVREPVDKLLEERTFRVPSHQRSYKWERKEHVRVLFEDIKGAQDAEGSGDYFLGMVVLKRGNRPSDRLEVIDGQQRLATVSIFLAEIRNYFRRTGDLDRADRVQRRFLADRHTRTLEHEPHLQLNTEDVDFFQRHVIEAQPVLPARRNDKAPLSHRRIADAMQEAAEWVEGIAKLGSPQTAGDRLIDWIDYLVERTRVVAVYVPSEENAYTLFETLNDRGLELTKADLIKNHLFSKAGQKLDQVRHLWTEMSTVLDASRGEEAPVEYIRQFWLSRYEFVRTKGLYDRVKTQTKAQRRAHDLAIELRDSAKLYAAFSSPESDVWDDAGDTTREHVKALELVGVSILKPLQLSVVRRFKVRELRRAFHLFVNWSVRFLVTSSHRTESTESPFSKAAIAVENGIITSTEQLAKELAQFVPDDEMFKSAFAAFGTSKAAVARYYLRSIEESKHNSPNPEWVTQPNSDKVNLEHVLPINPDSGWNVDPDAAEILHQRLGNHALLLRTVNSKLANKPFKDKQAAFRGCSFTYTAWIADQPEWTEAEITKRQTMLAEQAVKTWPLKVW